MPHHILSMLLFTSMTAAPEPANMDALRNRVNELEQELREVRASQGDMESLETLIDMAIAKHDREAWLNEERSEQIRELVQDVLADADTRASLSGGPTAGFDDGFYIRSEDGNFSLHFHMDLQLLWLYNHVQSDYQGVAGLNGSRRTDANDDYGFSLGARNRLKWQGHVFDPSLKYKFQVAYKPNRQQLGREQSLVQLQDAYIEKDIGEELSFRVGQFKAPFLQEMLFEGGHLQTVERSAVNFNFSVGRTTGAMMTWEPGDIRVRAMYNNGEHEINNNVILGQTPSQAVTARFDWKPYGNWHEFDHGISKPGEPFGIKLGAAINYQSTNRRPFIQADELIYDYQNLLSYTADLVIQGSGWNAFVAWQQRFTSFDGLTYLGNAYGSALHRDENGLVLQGGAFITDDLEAYARWAWGTKQLDIVDYEPTSGGGYLQGSRVNILTLGGVWILNDWVRWNLEFNYDFSPLLNGPQNKWNNLGLRQTDEPGQILVMSQMTLTF